MTCAGKPTSATIKETLEEALAEAVSAVIALEDALAASLRERDALVHTVAKILGASDGEPLEVAAQRAMMVAQRLCRSRLEAHAEIERVAAKRDTALGTVADVGAILGARTSETLEDAARRVMKEREEADAVVHKLAQILEAQDGENVGVGAADESLEMAAQRLNRYRLEARAELDRVVAERDDLAERETHLENMVRVAEDRARGYALMLSRISYTDNALDEVRWFSGWRPQ